MNALNTISAQWTAAQLLGYFGPRVGFSLLCGAIVGFERELKSKPTGLKTNMLICLGSALFTAISILLATALDSKPSTDASRVAAQIVTGVGFIGGGAILESRGSVIGLTTAATIWVVAAIGMIVGLGNPFVGVACAMVVVAVLYLLSLFEGEVLGRVFRLRVALIDPEGDARSRVHELLDAHGLEPMEIEIRTADDVTTMSLSYKGNAAGKQGFRQKVRQAPRRARPAPQLRALGGGRREIGRPRTSGLPGRSV